ncbi:glycosyltransferase [Sphingobacterium olei]|uniref:Glycosyltransferase n=1 Tax=Sphingobacterium olei TaxID=2571155 RepID=A0A4V5MN26_9SPHI|nr:glycosyltransferase [Sphingobacterium olei]TJZ60108.1 glycosyltransferase [Sphingobacterium olei]
MAFSCLISCFKKDSPIQLEKCLASIAAQSLPPDEVVFVKDGPLTIELESVINNYKQKLAFKFIAFEENKGLGYALNNGLEACSQDIVMRMDTDDICYENRFQLQYDYLIANPDIDILGGWAHDIDHDDNIIGERKYPIGHKDLYRLMWTNPLIHPTIAFRKKQIVKVGSYNPNVIRRQDYDLWIRAAAGGLKIENLPRFLIKYRFTENYYKKNNTKVVFKQAMMGYRGAKLLKLPAYTRIAVFVPVIRSLLPAWLIAPVHRLMTRFDPRK